MYELTNIIGLIITIVGCALLSFSSYGGKVGKVYYLMSLFFMLLGAFILEY